MARRSAGGGGGVWLAHRHLAGGAAAPLPASCYPLTRLPSQPAGQLAFALHDGQGRWDNPGGAPGRNYNTDRAGAYRLAHGALQLLPPALPLLLVSDLDGTLVGDDGAARAFASYWALTAAPSGSRLVFSTGRALSSFEALAAEQGAELLPVPDALICAVGTRVYRRGEGAWVEDAAWTAQLDAEWDLAAMREITYGAWRSAGAAGGAEASRRGAAAPGM